MKHNFYDQLECVLLEADPSRKCDGVLELAVDWWRGRLSCQSAGKILAFDDPGRPQNPQLVDPRKLKRRSIATDAGRIHLLHAIAHIEFNAINIALDAAYRFRNLPEQYVTDWLFVACEEALHFGLLDRELKRRNSHYGACVAHRGLWDMVCKTRASPLHRMALVPRVMEARGLDVTPTMIDKFAAVGDCNAVFILERIYRDEIGHVRIGNDWFQYFCSKKSLDPIETFRRLIREYLGDGLRGPFNWAGRQEAGFSSAELALLESDFVVNSRVRNEQQKG